MRCVEVTLDGWDTHANNHAIHQRSSPILDPAFAALIRDLHERDLLDRTVVLCCGEFGRTPQINPAGGRDHWPDGSAWRWPAAASAAAGSSARPIPKAARMPRDPHDVADVHATVLTALGLDPKTTVRDRKTRRPIQLSAGEAIQELLG